MINILIADDNIGYAVDLLNYISNQNDKIRVCNIVNEAKEVLDILNYENSIDVILLNYKILIYNGEQILKNIIDKNRYINSIILFGKLESVVNIEKCEMIFSIIYETLDKDEIKERIDELLEYKLLTEAKKSFRNKIINELLYLGYDISHKGTQYLISVIDYIAITSKINIKSIEKDIYSKIAIIYDESINNIKCRINSATNTMYFNCEIDKLKNYFKFNIDTKPKIKTIINTVINNIL